MQKPSLVAEAKADKEVAKAKEAAKEVAREPAEALEKEVAKMVEKALFPARRRMAVAFVSSGTAELNVTLRAAWSAAAGSRGATLQSIPWSGMAALLRLLPDSWRPAQEEVRRPLLLQLSWLHLLGWQLVFPSPL